MWPPKSANTAGITTESRHETRVGGSRRRDRTTGTRRGLPPAYRQPDGERRRSRLRLHGQLAVVLAGDDALRDLEAQARALPRLLRREEGLEHAGLDGGGDAG